MNNNQDKGFTLIELLIVIVILGILAAVTVFAVGGITSRGEDNACDIEERTLQTAIETSYAQNGNYPASLAALVPDFLASAPDATVWTYTSADGTAYSLSGSC